MTRRMIAEWCGKASVHVRVLRPLIERGYVIDDRFTDGDGIRQRLLPPTGAAARWPMRSGGRGSARQASDLAT
jgi:hypothetical protein